jgi:ketosteroid isomerase-like protein
MTVRERPGPTIAAGHGNVSRFGFRRSADLGESVLVLGHIDLTAQTTGIRFHEEVGQLGTFRDGKIARVHDYLSHPEALEAAGLSK